MEFWKPENDRLTADDQTSILTSSTSLLFPGFRQCAE